MQHLRRTPNQLQTACGSTCAAKTELEVLRTALRDGPIGRIHHELRASARNAAREAHQARLTCHHTELKPMASGTSQRCVKSAQVASAGLGTRK